MSDKLVEVAERNKGVVELVIGPPPSNIVTEAVMGEVMDHLEKINNEPDNKLVILSGAGSHFSYGASVQEHTPDRVGSMLPKFHSFIDRILSSGVPVMAKVRGKCLGGGFETAMACHLIYAENTASFAVPEIILGVFPPPASALLTMMIGDSIANEIVLTGAAKSGEELKACGLVNEAFDTAEAMEEAIDIFINKKILPLSASSLRKASQAVRYGIVTRYREYMKVIEKLYLKDLMSTNDANEGINAFIEKRKPEWKNN
ncbi:MAG: enoyl-CoA hydratase/isomerase family protein [Spirochaetes bacterium]|nr:enoyl-CoA hydratase/isomerase family protein [Spirochaetota bacterium]